jgi:hypothetical protein
MASIQDLIAQLVLPEGGGGPAAADGSTSAAGTAAGAVPSPAAPSPLFSVAAAVAALRDGLDGFHAGSVDAAAVGALLPRLGALLDMQPPPAGAPPGTSARAAPGAIAPSFAEGAPEGLVRMRILELLLRLPLNEGARGALPALLGVLLRVAEFDAEDNALLALRVIAAIQKAHRALPEPLALALLDFVARV